MCKPISFLASLSIKKDHYFKVIKYLGYKDIPPNLFSITKVYLGPFIKVPYLGDRLDAYNKNVHSFMPILNSWCIPDLGGGNDSEHIAF